MSEVDTSGYFCNPDVQVAQLENVSLDKPEEMTCVLSNEKIVISEEIRSMLATSSSVFRRMLEEGDDTVSITDMDAETFKWMVAYINCRDYPEDEQVFNNLLAAAEKYELNNVNTLRIIPSITRGNWMEELERAQLEEKLDVIDAIHDFLMSQTNIEQIIPSQEFETFCNKNRKFTLNFYFAMSFKKGKRALHCETHCCFPSTGKTTKIYLE